jgi:hypothetical protein
MTTFRPLRAISVGALIGALLIAGAAQASSTGMVFPLSPNAKMRQSGKIIRSANQHQVAPLGNHLRVVKPLGGTRPPAKTILAKRP